MHIFMTGATGFIGRAAVAHLQGQGHSITAWVRNEARAKGLLGSGVRIVGPELSKKDLRLEIEHCDAVVNLAGRPLAGVRWTKKNKTKLSDSRAGIAHLLSEQIRQCSNPPKVFISASAVGYYGDRGAEKLEEESDIGKGFLSELCSKWEQSALAARKCGTRVCLLRIGLVLGREGGMLQRLVPGFEIGLGIYIGTAKQRMSWIHLSDMARIIQFCLENPDINGPVNCTSPSSTSMKDFAKTLAHITNAKMIVPVPSIAIRILLGEATNVLTQSQDVSPSKLIASGFEFAYTSLNKTLQDECRPTHVSVSKSGAMVRTYRHPDRGRGMQAQFELTSNVPVQASPDTTFSFISSPLNLGLLTPSWMDFRIIEMPEDVTERSEIACRINIGIFPIKWRSVIATWDPVRSFTDFQRNGPYKLWLHEHKIVPKSNGGSEMKDTVKYTVPLGIIGGLIHKLFIKRALIRIFNYRRQVITLRFG